MATFQVIYARERSETFRNLDSAYAFYRVTDDAMLIFVTMHERLPGTGPGWTQSREILESKRAMTVSTTGE